MNMTRERADGLQKVLNEYIELRDAGSENKGKVTTLRMMLAAYIEPLVPEARIDGGMDLMGIVGSFASVLGIKIENSPGHLSVVDGHDDADPEDIGLEEYRRLYCIEVPGDIMKEALSVRSSKTMFELLSKNEAEKLKR